MIPTLEFVERKFEEFNVRMFGGRLPKPSFALRDVKSFLGRCVCKVRLLPDGRREGYDYVIEMNVRVDHPQEVVEDVIIHEMIHYFIGYNGLADTTAHGPVFKAIMKSINDAFGRKISISHRYSEEQRVQSASKRALWHVIAEIRMKDGRTFVKVLPRVVEKIVDFNSRLQRVRGLKGVDYYLHDNPFFNRFPVSVALRITQVDSTILSAELVGARPLRVKGNKVVEK